MSSDKLVPLIISLLVTALLISSCGSLVPTAVPTTSTPIPPSPTPAPPAAGTYSGSMDDGSTLRVVLVTNGDQIQAQEVGYRFVATGIEVKRVFLEGNIPFGEVAGNTLTFQIPVMLGFFGPIQYYDVKLTWLIPGEIDCLLKTASPSDDSQLSGYQMENMSIDATNLPEGAEMKDQYEFVLKP